MRVLCVSDVHGRIADVERFVSIRPSCDALVVSGDITNFGGAKEAKQVLEGLSKITKNIFAVPGNCDKMGVNVYLAESGYGVHGTGKSMGGIGFFGLGGSNYTPFNTPQEYSEESIYDMLTNAYTYVKDSEVKVLVSHPPPYTTKVDATSRGVHAGSRSVRRFLEEHEVDVVVTGHIHEAKGEDTLGETMLLNPGPLHMGYAVVKVEGEGIDIEFHKL